MIVSREYKIKEQDGIYYIVPSSVPGCPHCGGVMRIRDSKKRKLILADGTVQMFILRRHKCTVCGRVHLELPDIMVPHKHYARKAIVDTVNGVRKCSAEQSTIYRWNKEKLQLEVETIGREGMQTADRSCTRLETEICGCAGN